MRKLIDISIVFLAALALIFLSAAGLNMAKAGPSFGISNLDRLFLADSSTGPILNVRQNGTGDIVRFYDGATEVWSIADGGLVSSAGGLSVDSGKFVLGVQSETVTATFIITPTAPYVLMSSSAAFTSSTTTPVITSTATAGQLLVLQNDNPSDALIIDGTGGTVECKANVTLGAGDTLTLIYNSGDAVWYCVSGYDNS